MERFSKMKKEDIADLVQLYDRLLEKLEREPHSVFAQGELTRFKRKYPTIDDYDASGNYVGRVRNENGWTP